MHKTVWITTILFGFAYAGSSMPVMYGGYPEEDACGALGVIRGIDKHGDGFVAIRRGAGTRYRIKDKIYKNGTQVWMCDSHGKWIGILYGKSDCGTGTSISKRKPYRGSCKSGWVYTKYVVMTAG